MHIQETSLHTLINESDSSHMLTNSLRAQALPHPHSDQRAAKSNLATQGPAQPRHTRLSGLL